MPTLAPVTPQPHLHAFTGFGIELEYMIVHNSDLAVNPIADRVLESVAGKVVNELEHGELAWSNELVLHVIELKTNGPVAGLAQLDRKFHRDIREINRILEPEGARLLPTAMHPLFDPEYETRLWPHGQNEIYAAYDRIFGCNGHGWANLQSAHVNLPFFDDDEFRRLHAAVRVALPLIPALAAASPFVAEDAGDWLDTRLKFYRDSQSAVPEIAGQMVPEPVDSIADYRSRILEPMFQAIKPHDPDGILADDWLNSRGAIARFERQTIEIRVIDMQECPLADLAIAEAVVGLVEHLYQESRIDFETQQSLATGDLARILFATAKDGAGTLVEDPAFLKAFGFDSAVRAGKIWATLLERGDIYMPSYGGPLGTLLNRGTLSEALHERLGMNTSRWAIFDVYQELAQCLADNRLFQP